MRTGSKAKLKKAAQERDKAALDARKALADTSKALRDLTSALLEVARTAGIDERAEEFAARLRESDAMARLAASGSLAAARTRAAVSDAGLDVRAAEMAAKIRDAESTKQARARATKASDEAYARIGKRLAETGGAEKLGLQPRTRRFPGWLAALLGIAIGYGISLVAKSKQDQGQEAADDFELAAQRLTQDTADMSAPSAEPVLEDKIRTSLGQDPRTSALPRLNINVAEGTVFVRGTVPSGFDESAIREVIAGVEGVQDVDLQVTSKT